MNVLFPSSNQTRWQKRYWQHLSRFEAAGFKIVGTKMLHLTVEQARGFYAEHEGRPFFDGLVEFMTSGPIVVSVLEGENAVQRHRDLLGATNPANALGGYPAR